MASIVVQLFVQPSIAQEPTPQTFLFSNPIIDKGNDPWIVEKDGTFYYCYSESKTIRVKSSKYLHQIRDGKIVAEWAPPPLQKYSAELWAPELHFIDNGWYIYFAADDGLNDNHRMYALKSKDSDINNGFDFAGQMKTREDKWAIDGTVLQLNNELYFIWSGWEANVNVAQNLYIAKMSSPLEISADRVLISKPSFDWEKKGATGGLPTINEGPQILKHEDNVFIIYSAAGSWSNFYCLGQLKLTSSDPMSPLSWAKKSQPVFQGFGNVYSPGHASFLTINKQDWIVYHTAMRKDSGWNRKVKMQPFTWKNGEPFFGRPIDDGVTLHISY